ncbi:MAG: CNNM domain-containing protein [Spirochaetes bacterium]|nr:CNNM domain-containing protein [Spirochaetota bacterium]
MILSYLIVALLVLLSGLFSGLTLGLFSIDLFDIKRKMKLGDHKAKRIYQIRKKGNLLLCTLLLGNVAVNSTMAIFLGDITSGFLAGILATGLIVIFGEIIPQATFSRYALELGSRTTWLVQIFIFLLFPITFPLSWILDKVLGEELPTIWNKKEIRELIKEHEDSPQSNLDRDEERIILGALSFSEKKALDILTPSTVVYSLESNQFITDKLLCEIKSKGFTRIPVYEKNSDSFIGILLVKKLLGLKLEEKLTISQVITRDKHLVVEDNILLDQLFDQLLKKKIHMALVYNPYGTFTGIVTLEDIIEEILAVEIIDEADQIDNLQKYARIQFRKKIQSMNTEQDQQ